MANLLLSVLVTFIVLGGPLTLYFVVRILNQVWGGLKVSFLKNQDGKLGILVAWDNESFDIKVSRIKLDFVELVRGGRAFSHSFTFEDSSAKRKSFFLALNLSQEDLSALTDSGLEAQSRALANSKLTVEVETINGETQRFVLSKKRVLAQIARAKGLHSDVEAIVDKNPDSWSVLTRVFPWRKAAEEAAEAPKKAAGGHGAAAGAPAQRAPVDFVVTKVWIEPGCIVCDACEAEAPAVFWVKEDTCIVRENAPLDDAAAIKAAAEGCPVDVIKYTKVPKAAANA